VVAVSLASIEVARDIGRQWKVGALGGPGDRARNAGVILLLKPGRRPGDGQAEIAIATGSGAEGFITDALAGRVRDAVGEAAVSGGSYAAGLAVGVQLLAQAYAREFAFELTGAAARVPRAPARPAIPSGLFVILALMLFFTVMGARSRRRRPRGPLEALLWAFLASGAGRGGRRHRGGGGFGGGGGGFGGFGGGGGFSGGGASGRF
jgi:uncharacterized protein